jgi:hypothetical protein
MAVRIISTTQLRSQAAALVLGLRRGDKFLIQHYNEIVGYVTPDIPEDLKKKQSSGKSERLDQFKKVSD